MLALIVSGQARNCPNIISLSLTNVFGFLKSNPPAQGGVYGF